MPDIAVVKTATPDLWSCSPWDVLLASTLAGNAGRFVLRPLFSWPGATFSSLMPLRFKGGLWWVRARLATDIDATGLSLDVIRRQIASGGVEFDIEQAAGAGGLLPLARLKLRHLDPSCDDVALDPTMHTDSDVQLAPRWLSDFRRAAYRRSREGRNGG